MAKKKEAESGDVFDSVLKDLRSAEGGSFTRMGDALFTSEPREFVTTGVTLLDWAIQSRDGSNGGYAVGRAVELAGDESTGKSLLGGLCLGLATQAGYWGVLIDAEKAWSVEFARRLCRADPKRLLHFAGEEDKATGRTKTMTLEDSFDAIPRCIEIVRKHDRERPIVILHDGLAGPPTKEELTTPLAKEERMARRAHKIKMAMVQQTDLWANERVVMIFTNQTIANIGAGPGAEKRTTPGGSGPRFFCSTRIRLSRVGQIKAADADEPDGAWTEAVVKKNRLDPPGRKARFPIYYENGVSDVESLVEFLYRKGALGKTQGWVVFDGQRSRRKEFVRQIESDSGLLIEIKARARLIYTTSGGSTDASQEAEGIVEGVVAPEAATSAPAEA
jgi:recombination protein RecA